MRTHNRPAYLSTILGLAVIIMFPFSGRCGEPTSGGDSLVDGAKGSTNGTSKEALTARRLQRMAAVFWAATNANGLNSSYLLPPDRWLKRQWSYHHDFDGLVSLVDPILNTRHALADNPGEPMFTGKEMIKTPRGFGPLTLIPEAVASSDEQLMASVVALKGLGMEMDLLLWRQIQRSTNAEVARMKTRLLAEQRRLQVLATNGMILPRELINLAQKRMRWRSLGPRSNAVFRMEKAEAEAKAYGMSPLELQRAARTGGTNSFVIDYRAADRESDWISASNARASYSIGIKNKSRLPAAANRKQFKDGNEEFFLECEQIREETSGVSGALLAATRSVDDARTDLFEMIWNQSNRVRTEPPSLIDIQRALPERGAMVEFVVFQRIFKSGYPDYAAVIINKTGKPVLVRLGRDTPIEEQVSKFEEMMRSNQSPPDEQVESMLARLHQLLWQPIAAKLSPDTRKIFLAVDGMLHRIPFAALRTEGAFLSDRFVFHYIPTARSLLWPTNETVNNKRIEIWADPDFDRAAVPGPYGPVPPTTNASLQAAGAPPVRNHFEQLPGSLDELKNVKRIALDAGWNVVDHAGADATESHLQSMRRPFILHLSTHGFVLGDPISLLPPAPSYLSKQPFHRHGLAFAGVNQTLDAWAHGRLPDSTSDGALVAAEVLDLDLQGTWLTVLSACDTGNGQIIDGEGVRGLGQVFIRAGSKNALLSLWPLSDVYTARFMEKFYKELVKGGSPTEAAARVQASELNRLADESLWTSLRLAGPFVVLSTDSSE